jgi:hypothetical protein
MKSKSTPRPSERLIDKAFSALSTCSSDFLGRIVGSKNALAFSKTTFVLSLSSI